MAEKYWHRVCLMKVLADLFVSNTMLLAVPVFFWLFVANWPQKYFMFYGIPSYLVFCLWMWLTMPHTLSLILIFHQMCYYLQLRFSYVNNLLIQKFKRCKTNRIRELNQLLKEHNRICETVKQYNKFWCITLLIDAFLYTDMVLFISYLAFFSDLVIWLKIFYTSFSITFILCLFCIIFSATSVSTEVSNKYN